MERGFRRELQLDTGQPRQGAAGTGRIVVVGAPCQSSGRTRPISCGPRQVELFVQNASLRSVLSIHAFCRTQGPSWPSRHLAGYQSLNRRWLRPIGPVILSKPPRRKEGLDRSLPRHTARADCLGKSGELVQFGIAANESTGQEPAGRRSDKNRTWSRHTA